MQLLSKVTELPDLILDGLKKLFEVLFVPDDNYFQGKIEGIRAQVKFIDDIIEAVDMYKESMSSSNGAPSITVDLGKYGGEMTVLDLSWYKDYKNYGDLIVNGFMWGCFLWRVFMHLHTTIRGVSNVHTAIDSLREDE